MIVESNPCNFEISIVKGMSDPKPEPLYIRLKNGIRKITPRIIHRTYNRIRLKYFAIPAEKYFSTAGQNDYSSQFDDVKELNNKKKHKAVTLQTGDWVEVRSLEEISSTFDKPMHLNGLGFMYGMEDFCGKKLKVFKIVKTIKLESTLEVRKLRTPAVLLDGAFCDGKYNDECDRSCFYFWREEWLKRLPG